MVESITLCAADVVVSAFLWAVAAESQRTGQLVTTAGSLNAPYAVKDAH